MTKEPIKQEDITLEASLLNALAVKKNYDQFISSLEPKRLISITAELLKDYKKYYDKYNKDIDWGVFYPEFCEWHKKDLDETDLAYYRDTVFKLIRESNNENVYVSLLERQAKKDIENILNSGYSHDKLSEILTNLQKKKALYTDDVVGMSRLTDVSLEGLDNSGGVTWCLSSLQANLGSLMPGQFVLISADSNVGKSGLAITQVSHTLELKTSSPILYFDSEHTDKELRGRILANLYRDQYLGGFDDVWKHEKEIYKHFNKTYGEDSLLTMQIKGSKDFNLIEKYAEKYNPCLIIIDMIDIMSDSLSIQDLTPLYNRVRALANSGYRVIGTTQAGNTSYQDKETGEYKTRKWLTDKDTAGSKGGGKQGAAYCMVMIGKDDAMPDIRYITTTKKKRGKAVSTTCQYIEKYSCYKELL